MDQKEMDRCRELKQCSVDWFKVRARLCFTGSKAASVLGVNPYETKTRYTLEKLKLIEKNTTISDTSMRNIQWGKIYERPALTLFEQLYYEHEGHSQDDIVETGLYIYKDDRRFGASPDSVITNSDNECIGIVEVKCPQKIYTSIKTKTPIIPINHYIQMICEMVCVGVDIGYYVCWTLDETCVLKIDGFEKAWEFIYPLFKKYCDYYLKCRKELLMLDGVKRKVITKQIRRDMRMKRDVKESIYEYLCDIQKETVSFYTCSVKKETIIIDK